MASLSTFLVTVTTIVLWAGELCRVNLRIRDLHLKRPMDTLPKILALSLSLRTLIKAHPMACPNLITPKVLIMKDIITAVIRLALTVIRLQASLLTLISTVVNRVTVHLHHFHNLVLKAHMAVHLHRVSTVNRHLIGIKAPHPRGLSNLHNVHTVVVNGSDSHFIDICSRLLDWIPI